MLPSNVYLYPVIGEPLLLPSLKYTRTLSEPGTTLNMVGASGTFFGTTISEIEEEADVPAEETDFT